VYSKKGSYLRYFGIDRRAIFQWFFKKHEDEMKNELNWFSIGTNAYSGEGHNISCFIKSEGFQVGPAAMH
jgi:hypothetical protein